MKTVKTIIKEVVNQELDRRGLLTGDLAQVLSENICTAIQERKDKKGDACPIEWMTALYAEAGIDPYTASNGLRLQLSDCGKALIAAGAEIAEIAGFDAWWKQHTAKWSFESRYPTPKQIRDNWGKFKNSAVLSGPLMVK